MFWFVIIVLAVMVCTGVLGFFIGLKFLRFGEDSAEQQKTLKVVVVSFVNVLAGGLAIAATATDAVEPLVALIVTLITLLVVLFSFRPGKPSSGK